MKRAVAGKIFWILLFMLQVCVTTPSSGSETGLQKFRATPDQVLVLFNADWPHKSEGISFENDSREIAEYYVKMHSDPRTGKKPYILGLSCRHAGKKHLNNWFIREESNDNANGVLFRGKGPAPRDPDWVRDSRRVEIRVESADLDWETVTISCRSEITGEETVVTPLRVGLKVSGIPMASGDHAAYPPVAAGKGRCFRFDASQIYPGTVTVNFLVKDRQGKVIRNLSLPYYDIHDFVFSETGADGEPDDSVLEEDVLKPVRTFMEDPANALPDGTLLKDHILYIVLVHGIPYSAKDVYGIEHGATSNKNDQGNLSSLTQRLQTIYYPWQNMRWPVISRYISDGPDEKNGVVNCIITSVMRFTLMGIKWNPYMHPDAYSFLRDDKSPPHFYPLPPLAEQRKSPATFLFAYGVTRIDGATVEEAKRIIDYSLYASRYLRPEMDCRVRSELKEKKDTSNIDLIDKLREADIALGNRELEILGFGPADEFDEQGLPFLARPTADGTGNCGRGKRDWQTAGFYPGGMERHVISSNGLNYSEASIWKQLGRGVSVSAAGAPAYGGGPHITNATFWDNRILLKYLLRGRDLGEALLRSTIYVNWSTVLIGDPLLHPDLSETIIDTTPPRPAGDLQLSFASGLSSTEAHASVDLAFDPDSPEVALLMVTARDKDGNETSAISPLYSRRPNVTLEKLKPGTEYTFSSVLIDPYGNRTELPQFLGRSSTTDTMRNYFKRILNSL
jgi:hypothetical protein